jgi:hypothetical protein
MVQLEVGGYGDQALPGEKVCHVTCY